MHNGIATLPDGTQLDVASEADKIAVAIFRQVPGATIDNATLERVKKSELPQQAVDDTPGMNNTRAQWAQAAVDAFTDQTHTDREDVICDLLCDLGHWCDRHNISFSDSLHRAQEHYEYETQGQGEQLGGAR